MGCLYSGSDQISMFNVAYGALNFGVPGILQVSLLGLMGWDTAYALCG